MSVQENKIVQKQIKYFYVFLSNTWNAEKG